MSMWHVKKIASWVEPKPNYNTHKYNQEHNLVRCMKTRLNAPRIQCMAIWQQIDTTYTQNWKKKLAKPPKNWKKKIAKKKKNKKT